MTQILAVHGWAGHAKQWTYWQHLMEATAVADAGR
jgi:pimeloyl-[acyl-carrier protein] methyl ester esterase